MRFPSLRSALLLAALAAVSISAQAVKMPRATIDRNIELCQQVKRGSDPTAPKDPDQLLSLCTCATEGYFAGFSDTDWRALKKLAAGKDKRRAAMAMKDRTDVAELECRKTLNIEFPKD
jgi:hypothetical protein